MSIATGTTYQAIVGEIIVQRRKERGLNQEDLAQKVGMSQSAWSRVEKGESNLSLEQLAKVSTALKIKPHDLIAEADKVREALEKNKVKVADNKSDAAGWLLLGAAAIALIILASKGKK